MFHILYNSFIMKRQEAVINGVMQIVYKKFQKITALFLLFFFFFLQLNYTFLIFMFASQQTLLFWQKCMAILLEHWLDSHRKQVTALFHSTFLLFHTFPQDSLYLKTLRISPHGIGNCLRPLAAEDKHGRDKLKNANLLRKEVTYFQPF